MKKKYLILSTRCALFILFFIPFTQAQNPTPAPPQHKSIFIKNATIHNGQGAVYPNSSIGFAKGKIIYLSYESPNQSMVWDTIIEAGNKHIYPGLIALNTQIGLAEIEAIRAMNDFAEVGNVNPGSRSLIAYNTDSKVTPTVRFNGVLSAQICPQGGLLSGTSSLVNLDAWNWEDAVYKADEGLHINWPSMRVYFGNNADQEEFEKKQNERITKELNQLDLVFSEAYAYSLNTNPEIKNLNYEAMRNIFNGTRKLYIHADYVKEIVAAINFSQKYRIKIVLVGGADAPMVLDLLKENNIPIILKRTHELPQRDDDAVDSFYRLPKLLYDAGILYAISCEGFWQVRNLPFMAGTAAAYGLSKEEALRAVTLNPAQITGVDSQTGSIMLGKDATLLLTTGDLLDMKSNNVLKAYIQGRDINLDNVQHQLYLKYMRKYKLIK